MKDTNRSCRQALRLSSGDAEIGTNLLCGGWLARAVFRHGKKDRGRRSPFLSFRNVKQSFPGTLPVFGGGSLLCFAVFFFGGRLPASVAVCIGDDIDHRTEQNENEENDHQHF